MHFFSEFYVVWSLFFIWDGMGKKRPRKRRAPKGIDLTKVQKSPQKPTLDDDVKAVATFMHPCATCRSRGLIPVHFIHAMGGRDIPTAWELDEGGNHYVCRLCRTKHTIGEFARTVVQDEYWNKYRIHRAGLVLMKNIVQLSSKK